MNHEPSYAANHHRFYRARGFRCGCPALHESNDTAARHSQDRSGQGRAGQEGRRACSGSSHEAAGTAGHHQQLQHAERPVAEPTFFGSSVDHHQQLQHPGFGANSDSHAGSGSAAGSAASGGAASALRSDATGPTSGERPATGQGGQRAVRELHPVPGGSSERMGRHLWLRRSATALPAARRHLRHHSRSTGLRPVPGLYLAVDPANPLARCAREGF